MNGRIKLNKLLFIGVLLLILAPVQLSYAACVQPPANLVSWWPGDGSADDIIDANDGTLQVSAAFAPGKVGQAFSFDGAGASPTFSSVTVPFSSNFNFAPSGQFTIDAWVNSTSVSGFQALVVKGPFAWDWGLWLSGNRFLTGHHNANLTGSITVATGQWTHVAVTYNDGLHKLYVNGNLDTLSGTQSAITRSTDGLTLGSRPGGPPYSGLLDEVEIFDRALSQQEIQAIYDAGSAGKCRLAKELTSGPDSDSDGEIDLVVEIKQGQTTEYDFEITYSNSTAALIRDKVPAEFEVTDWSATNGNVDVFPDTDSNNPNKIVKSATIIEWKVPAGSNTLVVTVETRENPGKGHKTTVYRPTSCGDLPLNFGATAFEINLDTGELVLDGNGDPIVIEGPTAPLKRIALGDEDADDPLPDGYPLDGSGDFDGDSLTDATEVLDLGTDPCLADTDGDLVLDGDDECPLEAGLGIDGCPSKTVFITSASYASDFGGLAAADELCNQAAEAAGLSGSYKAWLSDSTGSPSTRFTQYSVPYVRVDGVEIAQDWADLTDGELDATLNVTEQNSLNNNKPWTNTDVDGTPAHSTAHCSNWSNPSNNNVAPVGTPSFTDECWTWCGISFFCDNMQPLYCFEQ